MNGDSRRDTEHVKELERQLRDKALLLANLEVIIEDYLREKRRLLEEIMALREKLWDLAGQKDSEGDPTGLETDPTL